jgi:TPR repeat protein
MTKDASSCRGAAEAGDAEAQWELVYRDGLGVERDPAQAKAWFDRAASAKG